MKDVLTAHEKATMTWRWTALSIYLLICFYDFMFVPIWYGINRPDISLFMEIINSTEEPMVQMELMKKLTGQHNPFTLMGGGLFHLAFGAILIMLAYIYSFYQSTTWFMSLPVPSNAQAAFMSTIVGAGAAFFGLYVGKSSNSSTSYRKK